jgi:hypothetical protein
MTRRTRIVLLCFTVWMAASSSVRSQPPPPVVNSGKPGLEHKVLWQRLGIWDTVVTKSGAAGQPPQVAKGYAVVRTRLGGRFVQQTLKCNFDGNTFEEFCISGYDRGTQKFTSYWIDTLGTSHLCTIGYFDQASGTVIESGETSTPAGLVRSKIVTKYITDDLLDRSTYEVMPDGTERERMTVRLTRRLHPTPPHPVSDAKRR